MRREIVAGAWLWTCRAGFEGTLVEEIRARWVRSDVQEFAPALVLGERAAARAIAAPVPVFARQGFVVTDVIDERRPAELARRVSQSLRESFRTLPPNAPWMLHVFVPDADDTNRMAAVAETLRKSIELAAPTVDATWADRRSARWSDVRNQGGLLAQACLVSHGRVAIGVGPAVDALSGHPGGRARMRVSDEAPSRAAMKLAEAIDWLGTGPAPGDRCVDLGAAPGGWSYIALERGAQVVGVDPGAMADVITSHRGYRHVRGSAFDFEPDAPVDWLLCDMVWRPLEVAGLLGKWARRGWARMLIANVKLPMKSKVEFVDRIASTLRSGGWSDVRMRQLYHDREEVTVAAFRK